MSLKTYVKMKVDFYTISPEKFASRFLFQVALSMYLNVHLDFVIVVKKILFLSLKEPFA